MKRSGDIPFGEWRLGLVIVVGLAIFLWASIRGGAAFLEKRSFLHTRFRNVSGLNQGSPVWFRGLEVGSVKSIGIVNEGDSSYVEVDLSVQRGAMASMHGDSRARIQSINFFGEKFLDLTPGTQAGGRLEAGSRLASDEAPEMADLMESGKSTLSNLDRLSKDLTVLTERLRDGKGSLGLLINDRTMYDDFHRMSVQVTDLSRDMNASQKKTADALASMAVQIDTLVTRMNRGQGTLGLLATDPRLYQSFQGTAQGADSLLGMAAAGQGSAGRVFHDAKLYDELSKSLERLNSLLFDIQKNPKKYFKFSVF